jgi:membrane protein
VRKPDLGAARLRRALDPDGDSRAGLAARAVRRYLEDDMADRAASLAYYGMLSLFPSLLIVFALIRLVAGASAASDLAGFASEHGASGAISQTLDAAVSTAARASQSQAGLLGAVGIGTLLYGASKALTAAGRALDVAADRSPAHRSLMRRAQDIGWTLFLLAIGIVAVALVFVSGRILEEALTVIGLSGASATIWALARWPATALLFLVAVAVVRWAAPTTGRGRFRLFAPGGLVAVVVWLGASAGYAFYVTKIATYNVTYGAFAGAVILLLWLWLSAAALLYGAELDAVLSERHSQVSR